MAYKFWKPKWKREPCNFVLEEYGAAGKPGWAAVSQPTGEVPKKVECSEFFKPGCHYRLMAKSIESGKFVGTVWKHYEPLPGGIEEKQVEKKAPSQPREPHEPRTPSQWMGLYAQQVADTLEPLAELVEAVRGLDVFGGGGGGGGGGGSGQGNPSFPNLEFSGKAPWVLHPYIVREIGNQITAVGDHIIDRLSALPAEMAKKMESAGETEEKEGEEEEDEVPLLPSPQEYVESTDETEPSLTPDKPSKKERKKHNE